MNFTRRQFPLNAISAICVSSLLVLLAGCGVPSETDSLTSIPKPTSKTTPESETSKPMTTEIATFGGGCFWCTEAVFQQIKGVEKVVSGYCNGQVPNPTYEQVCTGQTGHAEVIQITFDPAQVPFARLLEVHFKTHDPTTLNQQGADRGTQYRSGIYCHSDEQKTAAEAIVKTLDESGVYNNPIVTEVVAIDEFYPAEDYHQNYFKQNGDAGYCQAVIVPKVEKFRKIFSEILKSE